MNVSLPRIIVILGPTAAGKTNLGIEMARIFDGEVISADSRQVYKKMNIGTAKPQGEWVNVSERAVYSVEGIPHHMIDIVDPGEVFSLSHFKELALFHIKDILERNKLPIIVGGTGLYIWSIIDNLSLPQVPPNKKLRKSLEEKTLTELVELLRKLDYKTAQKIDLKNPRRVLRALEVVILTGKSFFDQRNKEEASYDALQIGINPERHVLYERIEKRIDDQIKVGLVEEVASLAKQKYGWQLPSMSGIGYKQIGAYLREEVDLKTAVAMLKRDTRHYARRQITWFKRDQRIEWLLKSEKNRVEEMIKKFLAT